MEKTEENKKVVKCLVEVTELVLCDYDERELYGCVYEGELSLIPSYRASDAYVEEHIKILVPSIATDSFQDRILLSFSVSGEAINPLLNKKILYLTPCCNYSSDGKADCDQEDRVSSVGNLVDTKAMTENGWYLSEYQ